MMNGSNFREETVVDNSQDDLIEYDPSGSEEPDQSEPRDVEIDENEVKTIYIEFIKNYQNSKNGQLTVSNSTQSSFLAPPGTSNYIDSVSCNVKYCKSINIINTELAFFEIPYRVWESQTVLSKWSKALQRDSAEELPHDFIICEKHFKPEHIGYNRKGKKLSRFAVPCLELPPKEDTVVPYFSDIDSIEQYIKGSAESYILDLKSRSMSEDSLESTSTTNGNLFSVKMEVTEDLKTVVKPVTISSSNSMKMFTTPIRRVNGQMNVHNALQFERQCIVQRKPPESASNIVNDPLNTHTVVIRKLSSTEIRNHKRKRTQDMESEGEGDLMSSYDTEAECDAGEFL